MNLIQAIVISILQGISELFPVSSLGHAVILPKLLHWGINEKGESWLAFLVALHIGTATALLIYFWEDWRDVIMAFVRSIQRGQMSQDHDERLAWMVVLGTVPAGLVGFILQSPLRSLFANPKIAAGFLVVNGVIMYVGERLIQRQAGFRPQTAQTVEFDYSDRLARVSGGGAVAVEPAVLARRIEGLDSPVNLPTAGLYRDITQLSWRDAAIVGFAQIGALIPGISRSGITMVAGLAAGLTHEAAARYAFLLATPIILAAGVLELPKLFDHAGRSILGYSLLGMVLAGIAAYLSVKFLMRYFESGRLYPFAYYCVAAGLFSLALLSVGV